MRSQSIILLEVALSFGAPLALAVRELFVLRRQQPPGGDWRPDPTPPPPPPLPSSLLPADPAPAASATAAKSRVLELA